MRIIYTSFINRGFSFNPFIVIPKWAKGDTAYLEHEKAHFNRQSLFPIWWVTKYFLSKQFRLQEELIAYKAEIKEKQRTNRGVAITAYARCLSQLYWGMIGYDNAIAEVVQILKESEKEVM